MSLSSPSGTEMFQFPEFPPTCVGTSEEVGFPIRTSPSQRVSPARRGFSQVIASFIGSSARASTVDPCYLDRSTAARWGAAVCSLGADPRRGTATVIYALVSRTSFACHAARLA